MKKQFLIAALAVSSCTFAQSFGVQLGGNLAGATSKTTVNGTSVSQNYKSKFGILAGIVAELPLTDNISFRPELNFIQKGGTASSSQTVFGFTITNESKSTFSYLELPLNVVYNVEAGPGNLFVGAGPTLGYGLSGKTKNKATSGNTTTNTDVSVKFDGKDNANDGKGHLKAFDFGANILAGYKLPSGIFIKAGYTFGLSNISPAANSTYKNKGLSIGVGYFFSQE
jgi:Outer membrane protein beta-barrel domain